LLLPAKNDKDNHNDPVKKLTMFGQLVAVWIWNTLASGFLNFPWISAEYSNKCT